MFGKRTRGTAVGRRSSLVLYGKTLLRSVVSAYLVILMVAFFTQRDLIYPVPRHSAAPKSPRGQLLALKSPEHRSVHAFYVPGAKRLPTVVLFHGNAEQLTDQLPLLGYFAATKPTTSVDLLPSTVSLRVA